MLFRSNHGGSRWISALRVDGYCGLPHTGPHREKHHGSVDSATWRAPDDAVNYKSTPLWWCRVPSVQLFNGGLLQGVDV